MLEPVDRHRIRDAQHRAKAVAHLLVGDHEVGEQLDLLQLLLQCHLREEGVDSAVDGRSRRLPGMAGRERTTTPGQQADRDCKHSDRCQPPSPSPMLQKMEVEDGGAAVQPAISTGRFGHHHHKRLSAVTTANATSAIRTRMANLVADRLFLSS